MYGSIPTSSPPAETARFSSANLRLALIGALCFFAGVRSESARQARFASQPSAAAAALAVDASTPAAAVAGRLRHPAPAPTPAAPTPPHRATAVGVTRLNSTVDFELHAASNVVRPVLRATRVALTFGSSTTGPVHRVSVGETVRVTIRNGLPNDALALHHHGVHMIGTPYYDGAAMITQAPLPPGGSMTYEFLAWPAGTAWYHSHIGTNYADGLKGLFIIEDESDPYVDFYDSDAPFMIYDWVFDRTFGEEYAYDVSKHFANDADNLFAREDMFETVGLINGLTSKNTSADGEHAAYDITVPLGDTVRVRVCAGAANTRFVLSVRDHNMTVIASDGALTKPVVTSRIHIKAGERFDVLLHADPAKGGAGATFAIHVQVFGHATSIAAKLGNYSDGPRGYPNPTFRRRLDADDAERDELEALAADAAARAAGVDERDTRTGAPRFAHADPAALTIDELDARGVPRAAVRRRLVFDIDGVTSSVVNATLTYAPAPAPEAGPSAATLSRRAAMWRDSPYVDTVDMVSPFSLSAHADEAKPPAHATKVVPVIVTARFLKHAGTNQTTLNDVPWQASPDAWWGINNITWADPVVPLYLTKARWGLDPQTVDNSNYQTHVVPVEFGEVVDIVVINNGAGSIPELHPFHLHGHRFWVVAQGQLPYRPAERPPVYNLEDPPLKDTLAVRTGDYAILRFVADNPGMWHFHCHLIVHMRVGIQMVFNVAEERQPSPPASYFAAQSYDGAMCPQ